MEEGLCCNKMERFLLFFAMIASGTMLAGAQNSIGSDRTALIAFKKAVGRNLNWTENTSPCAWSGIRCVSNRVTEVRLPGVGLSGRIPGGTLGKLDQLTALSLRWNGLSGPVPKDISNCKNLRGIFLNNNQFTGPFPDFIPGLPNLIKVSLSFNKFSGPVPESVTTLAKLNSLFLQNNSFTGSLPDINTSSLHEFDVSNNDFNGSIPMPLRRFNQSAFLGNDLCGKPLRPCQGEDLSPAPSPSSTPVAGGDNGGSSGLGAGAIVGIVLGALALIIILFIIIYLLRRKKNKTQVVGSRDLNTVAKSPEDTVADNGNLRDDGPKDDTSSSAAAAAAAAALGGDAKGSNAKKLVFFPGANRTFDLEDLLRASAEVLGKGSVGTAYKAVLEFGMVVAVKRLKDVMIAQKEFVQQIEQVGKMNHQTLVPLRAYYYSKEEKLLVYDYMPMGSLSSLLHGNRGASRTPLNWETRTMIALGAARGIEFLHSKGSKVSHGNIKSSNILLTKDYEARVSDFGLAQLVSVTPSANRIVGYRAPEVTDARKISQKADVYSFGVLLLELLTGKAPNHGSVNDDGIDLPRWVQSIVREEWTAEVFDVELLRHQEYEEDMVQMLQIAIDCVAQYPDQRPSMVDVVARIEGIKGNLGHSQGTLHPEIEMGTVPKSE